MNKDIAIKVDNLSKVYKLYNAPIDRLKESLHPLKKSYHKEFYALNDVSFEIKKGETVGIIGKNGSGKSTLLKIITGVLNPTHGKVTVNGRVAALLELGAGFNPEYTGMENIYFQGNLMGYSREEMELKVDNIIKFADIGDFIDQPVKNYSSGMFARLAFAVSINVEPDILIVDEALSVGDMAFQSKCFNKFKEFREKGVTILFVTHSVDTVIKYCQSAVLLNNGIVIENGPSKETVETFRKLMVNMSIDNVQKQALQNQQIQENKTKSYEFKKQLPLNSHVNDYGTKEVEIIDFAIFDQDGNVTNQLYRGEEYVVQMTGRFNVEVTDPIFAYQFRTVESVSATGTNTMLLEKSFGTVAQWQVITVKFNQQMILAPGNYWLAFGITKFDENGDLRVFHRLFDVVPVSVSSYIGGVGYAYVESICDVEYD